MINWPGRQEHIFKLFVFTDLNGSLNILPIMQRIFSLTKYLKNVFLLFKVKLFRQYYSIPKHDLGLCYMIKVSLFLSRS